MRYKKIIAPQTVVTEFTRRMLYTRVYTLRAHSTNDKNSTGKMKRKTLSKRIPVEISNLLRFKHFYEQLEQFFSPIKSFLICSFRIIRISNDERRRHTNAELFHS